MLMVSFVLCIYIYVYTDFFDIVAEIPKTTIRLRRETDIATCSRVSVSKFQMFDFENF